MHLDRVTLADARGHPGDLDGQDLGLALGQGDQLDDVERLAVLIGPGLLGVERQHRPGAPGRTGTRSRTCPLEASCSPPSPDDPDYRAMVGFVPTFGMAVKTCYIRWYQSGGGGHVHAALPAHRCRAP